jgi:phosphoglycolate phosphatase-like HAD superfamily hydrolase
MQCRTAVDLILSKIQVKNLFSCIQTRDDNLDKKSQIAAILDILKMEPFQAIVVGDRVTDVDSARAIGCFAVLVGNNNFAQHTKNFFTIPSLNELVDLNFFH